MSVLVADPDLTIHVGDALDVLRTLPAESVDLVATSPPFYALRDYGVEGQIGLEATPDEWVAALVGVFAECRRVLRPAGSMFVECGDSYNAYNGNRGASESLSAAADVQRNETPRGLTVDGLKPKDLLGQPFLLAFALRADGWYWRGCYPWAKPNAMPESAKDRCTTAHSYVLHFAKNSRYFFDGDAIAEPAAWERWGDQTVPKYEGTDTASGWMPARTRAELNGKAHLHEKRDAEYMTRGFASGTPGYVGESGMKHPRSVWTIPTQGFAGAHFATWPEALARRIILAGCPEAVCGTCGIARERIVEPTDEYREKLGKGPIYRYVKDGPSGPGITTGSTTNPSTTAAYRTVGFSDCGHGNYQPGTILDPFGGSGTTGLVARKHGRRAILIELNESYARLAAERCQQLSLLADVGAA